MAAMETTYNVNYEQFFVWFKNNNFYEHVFSLLFREKKSDFFHFDKNLNSILLQIKKIACKPPTMSTISNFLYGLKITIL